MIDKKRGDIGAGQSGIGIDKAPLVLIPTA
jgi:hypothetical protein